MSQRKPRTIDRIIFTSAVDQMIENWSMEYKNIAWMMRTNKNLDDRDIDSLDSELSTIDEFITCLKSLKKLK